MTRVRIPIALVFMAFCCAGAAAQDSERITIAAVGFIERNPTVRFFRPISVRVNSGSASANVQVRLFADKTLQTVKRFWIGETGTGCVILRSRVNPYDPTFLNPDVSLMAVDLTDLRCGTDGFYKKTPFVLVVESTDAGTAPAFRIDKSQLDRYFAHSYEFAVEPSPRMPCHVAAPTTTAQRAAATRGMRKPEQQQIADLETRRQFCIKSVSEMPR